MAIGQSSCSSLPGTLQIGEEAETDRRTMRPPDDMMISHKSEFEDYVVAALQAATHVWSNWPKLTTCAPPEHQAMHGPDTQEMIRVEKRATSCGRCASRSMGGP